MADALSDTVSVTQEGLSGGFAIEERRNPLLAVLRATGDGVMLCDTERRIRWMNGTLRAMLALGDDPYAALVGQPLTAISLAVASELANPMADSLASETPASLECSIRAADGREKSFQIHIVPLESPEGVHQVADPKTPELPYGCVVVFRDITTIRNTEKMRRDFVANVSHELRTPLSVLKGYAETLLSGALNDAEVARDFVEVIFRHAIRLSRLVEDLLDLSRLESPDYQLEAEPLSMKPVFDRILQMERDQADTKHITLTATLPDGLPFVCAQSSSLEQVLMNLVDNAIKYTPEGGRIEIAAREVGQFVQISVADTGMGIEAKHFPRLFERFYRVDKARSRDLGGTGLGLSIVKHIVQLHGGDVWVESQPNKGSTFFFTLRKAI
jgi:two-component system phosphate regulon sensor histidine kinase PhoR